MGMAVHLVTWGALSFGPESRNRAVMARFGRVVQCDGGEGTEGLLR